MPGRLRCVWQQGRCFIRPKVGRDCRAQEVEHRTTLLRTRLNYRPGSFAPIAAVFTTSTLRDTAVDGDETNGLLSQVVGGFDVGFGDEPEVAVCVFPEPLRQIVRLSTEWRAPCRIPHELPAGFLQGTSEVLRRRVWAVPIVLQLKLP